MGGRPDTGYAAWAIAADSLGPESIVYSVGVGDDISFDLDLIEQFGLKVHAFDPTPASRAWLQEQRTPSEFVLHTFGVADFDGDADFYAPRNPDWISHSVHKGAHTVAESIRVPMRRLSTLMEMLGHRHIDLLKLDIEAGEYAVIEDLVSSSLEVKQLLVEFHHRFEEIPPAKTRRSIEQLNEAGFRIYHVSPYGEEYSFLRV